MVYNLRSTSFHYTYTEACLIAKQIYLRPRFTASNQILVFALTKGQFVVSYCFDKIKHVLLSLFATNSFNLSPVSFTERRGKEQNSS